jgi:hypothetical protein
MTVSSIKFAVGSMLVAGGLAASGAASALTINTTGMQANSVLTFTVAAYGSATAAGINFRPFANMTALPMVTVVDPETGLDAQVPSFNQPVTKADVSVGWDLKITPTAGAATRSGLQLVRKVGSQTTSATLANFNVKFTEKVLYCDIFTPTGVTTAAQLYTFKDNGDLKISLKGLVLNMSQTISNLVFTKVAQDTLATALNLSAPLKATLATQDWGTLAIKVTSYKRTPAMSDKALVPADVPAP